VVGAGVGGLAAAIATAEAGFDVEVLERAELLSPIGAGLSVWPNGVRALRRLRVADWIDAGGTPFGDAGIHRGREGTLIASTSPEQLRARYGEPIALVHRAELLGALIERLGAERVRLGSPVRSASADGTVRLESGEELRAEIVVGADGIDSAVRDSLLGDGPAEPSGIVAYRAVLGWGSALPAGEYWGVGEVFGLVPLSDGRLYWYAAFREDEHDAREGPPPDPGQLLARLRERFGSWAQPIPAVLQATSPSALLRHPLRDRPPGKRWGAGRVTLLGDAAHPMLPFLGQGACCALEDAVALGESLIAAGEPERGLREYERLRIPRARMLVKRSRSAARAALLARPFLAGLRDDLLGSTPAALRLRQLDRVIGSPLP